MYDCVDTMSASLQILEGVIATLSVRLDAVVSQTLGVDLCSRLIFSPPL